MAELLLLLIIIFYNDVAVAAKHCVNTKYIRSKHRNFHAYNLSVGSGVLLLRKKYASAVPQYKSILINNFLHLPTLWG